MAAYVKRAATICNAKVSLVHVVDPAAYNGLELYVRPLPEVLEEHLEIGRERLHSFLTGEFPADRYSRLLESGDAATEISRVARVGKFDLIIMPTHSGRFRQMLLGSTAAKVINDADCPVMTSRHAETIAPRPLEHREWLCAIGLTSNSERVLRYASAASKEARSRVSIIHTVQSGDPGLPITLDLEDEVRAEERHAARDRIRDLQRMVGAEGPVHIAMGAVKEGLLEAARQTDADVLIIGRGPHTARHGRMRDLTYAMVRDSPFPVISV